MQRVCDMTQYAIHIHFKQHSEIKWQWRVIKEKTKKT